MNKKVVILEVAKEICKGINDRNPAPKKEIQVDTLCDFGQLGLASPKEIATAFYNTISKKMNPLKNKP